jgi:hypothetical protein
VVDGVEAELDLEGVEARARGPDQREVLRGGRGGGEEEGEAPQGRAVYGIHLVPGVFQQSSEPPAPGTGFVFGPRRP